MHLASERGIEKIVQILIDSGADVDVSDVDQWTSLHHASGNGNFNVVMVLIDHGKADVNAKSNETVKSRFYDIVCQYHMQRKIEIKRKIETKYLVNFKRGHQTFQCKFEI